MSKNNVIAEILQLGMWGHEMANTKDSRMESIDDLIKDVAILESIPAITPEKFAKEIYPNSKWDELPFLRRRNMVVKVSLYLKAKQICNKYIGGENLGE